MAAQDKTPVWVNFQGAQRLQAEYRSLIRAIRSNKLHQIGDLALENDNIFEWKLSISGFDSDSAAGRNLNSDLNRLQREYGQAPVISMAITFPPSYPNDPPFLRVIRPRMVMYTGHVTAGGSICIEALTHSGGQYAWKPSYTVESILMLVITNMLHCDTVYVQTPTGPGGQAGPLRVDFAHARSGGYSQHEARAAFDRMVRNHGWNSNKNRAGGSGAAINRAINLTQQLVQMANAALLAGPQQFPTIHPAAKASAAAPPPPKPKPMPAPAKRQRSKDAMVIDLTDDSSPVIGSKSKKASTATAPAPSASGGKGKRPRHIANAPPPPSPNMNKTRAPAAAADSKSAKPPPSLPSTPKESVADRLAKANAVTRLRLDLPPDHWEVDDELLHGRLKLIDLPLDRSLCSHAFTVGGTGTSMAATQQGLRGGGGQGLDPTAVDEGALAEVMLLTGNNLSEREARQALIEAKGDIDAALMLTITKLSATSAADKGRGMGARKPALRLKADAVLQVMNVCFVGKKVARAALLTSGGRVDEAIEMCFQDAASLEVLARSIDSDDEDEVEVEVIKESKGKKERKDVDVEVVDVVDIHDEGAAAAPDLAAKRKKESRKQVEMERQRKEQAIKLEMHQVLQRFQAHSGLKVSKVVRLIRCQNLRLWTKYVMTRDHIAHDLQTQGVTDPNVRQLWHGADPDTLKVITTEGFDIRVSNAGALGQGTYFADSSRYSDNYAKAGKHNYGANPGGAMFRPAVNPGTLGGAFAMQMQMQQVQMALQSGLMYSHPSMHPPQQQQQQRQQVRIHQPPQQSGGSTSNQALVFSQGVYGMLLCDVCLGKGAPTPAPCRRKPLPGCQSASTGGIHCVYDNAQAYPAYLVQYMA